MKLKLPKKRLVGVLFLLPMALGLLVFRIFAFFRNIGLSFTKSGAMMESEFVGIANYINILEDENFWQALSNTFKFVIICLPLILIIAIGQAVLLNEKLKFREFFRIIYFIPAVILPIAAIQVFQWIFNTDFGLVNSILLRLGMDRVAWFGTNISVTFVVSLTIIYLMSSVPTFILLGGLQSIPQSYYEAASIDGASKVRQFFTITLPMLTPSIFYVIITSAISLFKLFNIPYTMLGDEAVGLRYGKTLVYYFYQNAFEYRGMRGYASAISVVLMVIILIFTIFMFRLQRRWVNYDR